MHGFHTQSHLHLSSQTKWARHRFSEPQPWFKNSFHTQPKALSSLPQIGGNGENAKVGCYNRASGVTSDLIHKRSVAVNNLGCYLAFRGIESNSSTKKNTQECDEVAKLRLILPSPGRRLMTLPRDPRALEGCFLSICILSRLQER